MWAVLWEVAIVFLKWFLDAPKKTKSALETLHDKARDAQRKSYEESGVILEGKGSDITRMALARQRVLRILLAERKLRKSKGGSK